MAKRHVGIKFEKTSRVYVYRVPDNVSDKLKPGQMVKVPGSAVHPQSRWLPIVYVHEEYKEQKGVNYKEILEVRPLNKRTKQQEKQEKVLSALVDSYIGFYERPWDLNATAIPTGTDWLDDML